jgi:hypothetical protein
VERVDVKTKLGTMLLAAAGVLTVAVAQAQPAAPPTPAPAPAPAPPPPAADFNSAPGVAPAALPAAPAQPPPPNVSWGTPAPDAADAAKKPPKPNPFAFSWFTWTQSASTKIFGVGKDYIGTEDEVYRWDFSFRTRYAIINEPRDTLTVGVSIPWGVELTNSGSTTQQRQTLLGDIGFSTGYSHAFIDTADKEYRVAVGPSASVSAPTSLASQGSGTYANTNLSLGARAKIKLAGSKSSWFPNLLLIGSAGWLHRFSKSYVGVNSNIYRPRMDQTGKVLLSDEPTGSALDINTASFGFTYAIPIYTNLALYNSFSLDLPFTHDFSADNVCVTISTNCAQVTSANAGGKPTIMTPETGFDISLSYDVFDYGFIGLGYKNNTSMLGPDGQRRSMFYSPSAQFYASLTVTMEFLYDKIRASAENKKAAETKKKTAENKAAGSHAGVFDF